MIVESQISLFFFFITLDEKQSIEASQKTLQKFKQYKKKQSTLSEAGLLVYSTYRIWKKIRKKIQKGRAGLILEQGWLLPETVDISPWREYQKKAVDDEILVLVWSQILKISDEDISSALGLSEGTVRFRISRAAKSLGDVLSPGSAR